MRREGNREILGLLPKEGTRTLSQGIAIAEGKGTMRGMYPFGGTIIAPFMAGYLASVICRWQKARGKKPGFGSYSLAISITLATVWVITFGDELLKKSNGNVPMWMMLLLSGVPAFVAGSIPAAWIVERYRKRYSNG